ncbi:MAG: M28 family peptidase [Acidobacteria bacterium]|nr:M28 family peptidase [Acidobacteriota bacterium]
MTRLTSLLGSLLLLVLAATVPAGGQAAGIRGFPDQALAEQRALEDRFRAVPSAEKLREYMKAMSAEPHVAGRPGSRKVAEYALEQFKSFGLSAQIEEQEAYMPWPTERRLEIVAPSGHAMTIQEPPVAGDPDTVDDDQTPIFNAYSADGDVTAEVVYVNYGVPADYEQLEKLGVSVKGKIVIARYGGSWRGIKPKVAWEHGAVGCLIYSDPKDDGFFQGDVYPNGPYRPEFGAQRGSVMDMPVHTGDPLTPGYGAEPGGKKMAHGDAKTILKIPVMPISWGDALPIFKAMHGPVAPEAWRGSLPVTYKVGPGPATLRLKLTFDWRSRPLHNVIARIDGMAFPDEWIVFGNHHDAWVNGADDPISGAAALLETARGLGELVKSGWKPKRTIVFALWDGEEWGLLGSTEWAERHRDELNGKGVVYINTDSSGKGWLNAGGSHSLQQFIAEVARDINDPRTGKPLLDEARRRTIMALPEAERAEAENDPGWRIAPLGSGSDFTPFLQHLTLASLNLGFGGESPGGVYHSVYDTFNWYTKYSDSDFSYGRTLSQLTGTAILRMSESTVLPFRFSDMSDTLARYVAEIQKLHAGKSGAPPLDLGPLTDAVRLLARTAQGYERAFGAVPGASAAGMLTRTEALGVVNQLVYSSERRLGNEKGLPRREWFRHQVYAPGFYTGYGVKTLPQIREGIEEGQWDDAREGVAQVTAAIRGLSEQIERATAALGRATR